jgi:cell division septal protein FtsQ
MWFRRKIVNRRLGRAYVLDVKLRSSQVRAARLRWAATFGAALLCTVLGVYLLRRAGEWALDRLVYENKAFSIVEVDLETDGVIAVEQLRRWSGVQRGQNLLALDLARVKRDLELVPLVQSVSLERILPHTLRIRVAEREPIAQINIARPKAGGGVELAVYQLDAEGWVIVPLDPRQRAVPLNQPNETLPLISGIKANDLQPGHRLEAPQVRAALELVASFDRSAMASLTELTRIDVSAPEILIATTGQGSLVTFGLTDIDQQLRRWHDIFEMGQRLSKAISTLDLAVTNSVPARWLEASALPPATPKPPKTSRLRKKNV